MVTGGQSRERSREKSREASRRGLFLEDQITSGPARWYPDDGTESEASSRVSSNPFREHEEVRDNLLGNGSKDE